MDIEKIHIPMTVFYEHRKTLVIETVFYDIGENARCGETEVYTIY